MARARGTDRYLTTVLFTDIVDSTRHAEQVGDRAWRDLVEQHNEVIRRQLRRFGGREVDTAGDGFFAAFDAPARAVACALTIADQLAELGLQVRAGVHTGEVEEAGGKLRGIAVHIGARVGAAAEPGEVLVSATVRDLVTGTAVDFEDRGVHELKGVGGEWHLYAAARGARFADEFGAAGEGGAGRDVAAVKRTMASRARRRRFAYAGVAVLVALSIAVGTFIVTRPPPSLPAIDANSAGVIDGASGRIEAQVPVGSRPDGVAYGEGAVWVANGADGTVSRIDPAKRTVVKSIDVGEGPGALAVGFGAVWVANSDERTVSRIDAASNKVVHPIAVGSGPTGVATGAGAVWVTNSIDGTLSRIDPVTDEVSTYEIGSSPGGIAGDETSIWLAAYDRGEVARVNPSTGEPTWVRVGNGPRSLAIGGGFVWVANELDDTISQIDPTKNSVTATIAVGRGPASLAVAPNGEVWVASAAESAVYRIDPSARSTTRFELGAAPQALAVVGTDVWVSARASNASHRGGTLRVAASQPLDTIDPAFAFSGSAWSLLSMTNDGLVAWRRAGGIIGAAIVPDLAVAVPEPTDGGLTYAFQLRPNLAYSDGQPISASDFRLELQRVYNVPSVLGFPAVDFYNAIQGAEQCFAQQEASCDLSSGIVTDDAAATISFHLTRPDPDFLQKLALTFAVAVPPSVPTADIWPTPVPATGAYMIDSVTDAQVRLVRNPAFHEWAPLARPDGYPDEIAWTIGPSQDDELDKIVAGTADAMAPELPPANAVRLEQLHLQYPAQVHASLIGTAFLHMNTAVPPFDNVDVRRAVSFSLDRAKMVDALGGEIEGRVTCQVLSSHLPGYSAYCPYTINPNPGGTWIGPDLAAARDLIAAAQPSQKDITVAAAGRFVPVAESAALTLNQLGFSATVRAFDSPADEVDALKQDRRIEAAVLQWLPDIRATVDEIYPIFRCGDPSNFTYFCDVSIGAGVDNALKVQQDDPAAVRQAWANVDRTIVDLAPAAPLFNILYPDVVSASVGNYQFHPQWGPLYDQFWVK